MDSHCHSNHRLLFVVKKIPELARGFGKAEGEIRKARFEVQRDVENIKRECEKAKIEPQYKEGQGKINREKLEAIADSLDIDYTIRNKNFG